MSKKNEIIVALIALGGTLFGVIFGTISSIWVTNSQLNVAIEHKKIDINLSQLEIIRSAIAKYQGVFIDTSDVKSNDERISKYIDAFQKRSNIFLSVSHYFSESLEEEINSTRERLDSLILSSQLGNPVDQTEAKSVLSKVEDLDEIMRKKLNARLREYQERVDILTSHDS